MMDGAEEYAARHARNHTQSLQKADRRRQAENGSKALKGELVVGTVNDCTLACEGATAHKSNTALQLCANMAYSVSRRRANQCACTENDGATVNNSFWVSMSKKVDVVPNTEHVAVVTYTNDLKTNAWTGRRVCVIWRWVRTNVTSAMTTGGDW